MSTDPADVFTQQTFEFLALGDGCHLIKDGEVALDSPACVDAIATYAEQILEYSPGTVQDVDTTRATYFAGEAAMMIWSPFILDELAGLRNDALPTCDECADDPLFLATTPASCRRLSARGHRACAVRAALLLRHRRRGRLEAAQAVR